MLGRMSIFIECTRGTRVAVVLSFLALGLMIGPSFAGSVGSASMPQDLPAFPRIQQPAPASPMG